MDNDEYLTPPGCKVSIVRHPSGVDKSVEVATFPDHRYAFFYWATWRSALQSAPALVTFDWHEDLAAPDDEEQHELIELDLTNPRSIALFCWEKLSRLNDGHVLAAAYLNLIGDVFVLRKQRGDDGSELIDREGRPHIVRCFRSQETLMAALQESGIENAILDIDLDYFTESPDSGGGGPNVTLVPDTLVTATLDPQSEILQWFFDRCVGMTIATEPEFCGGIVNSNRIFSVLSETLFFPQLLSDGASWRHLIKHRGEAQALQQVP